MRSCFLLLFLFVFADSYAQCDKVAVPEETTIRFACRDIHVLSADLNGSGKNYLKTEPGQTIRVSFKYWTEKGCEYCPECHIQLYWGIHGKTSSCFTSFSGYTDQSEGQVSSDLKLPDEDGTYYITLGGTIESGCRNSPDKPFCEKDKAIAVVIVGKPSFTARATVLESALTRSSVMLVASSSGVGCTGLMNRYQWFLNDSLLVNETDSILAADREGTYAVEISNCAGEKVKEIHKVKFLDDNTAQRVRLEKVYFEQGSYALISSTIEELDKLFWMLNSKPDMEILLEGHTDSHGGESTNQKLSEMRVKQIQTYLVNRGIKKKRIKIIGYGGARPVASNCCEETRKLNRRVEMVILKE